MELKPCPFCGNKRLVYNWDVDGDGQITCVCGARMIAKAVREHYELVSGDLYRKIPSVSGKDVVVEKWNRRKDG